MIKEDSTMKHEAHTDCYFIGGMYDGMKRKLLSGTKEIRVCDFGLEDTYRKAVSFNDDVAIFRLKSELRGCVIEYNELKKGERR